MSRLISPDSNPKVWKIKQGKSSLTIKVTVDAERGIETREITIQQGRRTRHTVIDIDLATGKPIALDGAPLLATLLQAELAALTVALSDRIKTEKL